MENERFLTSSRNITACLMVQVKVCDFFNVGSWVLRRDKPKAKQNSLRTKFSGLSYSRNI